MPQPVDFPQSETTESDGQPIALKTSIARFELSKGVTVSVQAPRMDLAGVIRVILDTAKLLKKAQAESLDIMTAARVMRDRANATT